MSQKQLFRIVVATLAVAIGAITVARAEEKEEKVSLKDVPAAVKKTIEEKAKDAKINEIEKKTEDKKVTFEVKIEKDKKEREFYVAEDGKFLGWEDEDKDADKGKHDEKNEHKDKDDDKD